MLLVIRVTYGDQLPEIFGVIHFPGVTQLVDEDIINKLEWQLHECDIKTNGAVAATAPPSAAGVRKTYAAIAKIVLRRQICEAFWQIAFRFDTQGFDDDVAHLAVDAWLLQ